MADTFSLDISHAESQLKALGKVAERDIVSSAIKGAAEIVLRAAQRNTPIDTGLMEKSMRVKAGKRRRGQITYFIGFKNVSRIVKRSSKDPNKKRWFYPAVIEYGAKDRPAQAPMRRAFESSKEPAEMYVQAKVSEGIENWARFNAITK